MISRKNFLKKRTQKSAMGFVVCVFLVLTLFLTFPVIDTPLAPEAYAAPKHSITVKICFLNGICISVTYEWYHDHTS